jgi:hypothetical protein
MALTLPGLNGGVWVRFWANAIRPYQNLEFVGVNGIDPSSGGH